MQEMHALANRQPVTSGKLRAFRGAVPKSVIVFSRLFRTDDGRSIWNFLKTKAMPLPLWRRLVLLRRFYKISTRVQCAHLESEILAFASEVLKLPASVTGSLVEAGCFKGGSSAKFSLVAAACGRRLIVCDSFCGIPSNAEEHTNNLYGGNSVFNEGDYAGALEEVKANIRQFGDLKSCTFVEGYFEESLLGFHEPLAAVYLDVDLASSTRTCLKYFWPLLAPGGIVFSQDGHLPLVVNVLLDEAFWQNDLRSPVPTINGIARQKLIWFRKPLAVP